MLFSDRYSASVDFQLNNGWVAFREVQQGVRQVWVRAPSGATTQLSVYNTDSAIDAIGAFERRFGPGPQEVELAVNLARAAK
jgi:hypothetical protein